MAVLKRVFPAVVSAVLLAASAISVRAADLQWAAFGTLPQGTATFSMVQDVSSATAVWAATNGQGLQHTDDGKTWRQVAAGSLPGRLWKVVLDPSRGPGGAPPIYVGSAGQGFFKSLDNGKSWQGSVQGLPAGGARNVRGIAMGVNTLVIGTSDGAYRSTDGGRTWQAAGLGGYDISAIAFARYASPPTLVAAIDGITNPGARVVESKDLGASWTPIKSGLPADIVVTAIAAGPLPSGATQRPLFLAGNAGVFKSDDGGQGWGQMTSLPPQGYSALSLSAADPNIVYVASDGGGGAGGGVWRSTDRGGTWTGIQGGLTEKGITAISVGRDNPATLVAAAWNPDKGTAPVFGVSDTQAPPQGSPEAGVCPEPSCQGGTQPVASATPGAATPSPSPTPTACVSTPSPVPSTSATTSPSTSATASPTASSSPTTAPAPCPTTSPPGTSPRRPDIPLPLAIGIVLVLAGLLLGSIVVTRLRG